MKAQAARGQAGAALFSLTVCHDMRMNIVQQATYSYSSILHSIPALSSASGTAKPGKPRGAGTSCREVQGGSTEVRPPSGEKGNWWWEGHERSNGAMGMGIAAEAGGGWGGRAAPASPAPALAPNTSMSCHCCGMQQMAKLLDSPLQEQNDILFFTILAWS